MMGSGFSPSQKKVPKDFSQRRMLQMISVSKAWAVSITVCIAICCGMTAVANAALLRAVRVGEHKDFTRLAFEFDSPARYSQPVLKDKDTITVTFPESKTPYTLPRRNLARNTRHFDSIAFDQQGSDLTAELTVRYPHFELKAFTLLKPHRVVIDVYWLDAPSQAKIVTPPALENVKKPAPLTPEEAGPKLTKKITAVPKPQKSEEPVKPMPVKTIPEKTIPEQIAKIPEKDEASLTKPDKAAIPRPPETTTPDTVKLPQATPRSGRLQVYSVVALIALNIIIIVIFAVMNRSRLRRTELSEYDEDYEIADALAEQDFTLESIDKEIKEKFQKYEAL
jgi:hypothetical protein